MMKKFYNLRGRDYSNKLTSQLIKYELLARLPELERTIGELEEARNISRETWALEFDI